MKNFQMKKISFAILMMCMAHGSFAQSDVGQINILGSGDRLGVGQILEEETPKAKSNVTRSSVEKASPVNNPFQLISQLPGVFTGGPDATGMFSGVLTVRGFNSDQLGFTVNGVPVNDSGNFAVYPAEYVDPENLCNLFLTQGSTDTDAPHVGATGGNIGMVSCAPEDKQRVRVAQTLGGLNLSRTYARYDTGRFGNDTSKIFFSYSHSEVDKWKGAGQGKKDHMDIGFQSDIDKNNTISGNVILQEQKPNNFMAVTRNQINNYGYSYDYATTWPVGTGKLVPVNGVAQAETAPSPTYYMQSMNPFRNMIASVEGKFKLNDNTELKVLPYFWYGYGTGGTQNKIIKETNGFLNAATGSLISKDVNGDGDTLDTIAVAGSNITRTQRPGITTTLTHTFDNHELITGLWYERATHTQTSPVVPLNADGTISDIWQLNGRLLNPDGSITNIGRNEQTISTASQFFVQDNISLSNNQLGLSFGFRTPRIVRDFTSFGSDSTSYGQTPYSISHSYQAILPQMGIRYNVTPTSQVYFSVAENMKAPPNYIFEKSNLVNGDNTAAPEKSTNVDLGYRLKSGIGYVSAALFYVDYKNRQATAYNPELQVSTFTNAGGVTNKGFEFEFGSNPIYGWSTYVSFTNNNSSIKSDLRTSAAASLATSGKEFPLTPKYMFANTIQYAQGPYYAQLKTKYNGALWADLTNNEKVPGFTLFDLAAGYKFENSEFFKSPLVRLNVSNLTNKKYLIPTGITNTSTSDTSVQYWVGAPRLVSVTLQSDF